MSRIDDVAYDPSVADYRDTSHMNGEGLDLQLLLSARITARRSSRSTSIFTPERSS
jgi:hypothetical protein